MDTMDGLGLRSRVEQRVPFSAAAGSPDAGGDLAG